ncbi:MAG: gamma-glutamyltransferase [Terriglobales bacterium]
MTRTVSATLTACLVAAALSLPAEANHLPAEGMHGAVSSAEVHATQAGIQILKEGGNAVDAAVAVGFALAVTHSDAGNLGGGGFMLIRQADGHSYFVDFREEAPGQATPTMYQNAQGKIVKGRSLVGMLASGIPGTVAGLTSAQKRLGKLSLAQDMAPAIRLAEDGFALDEHQAAMMRGNRKLGEFPNSRRIFQRDGNYYKPGDIFKQPELANTLKEIARGGAAAFYRGRIAQQLAAFEQAHGGLITRADLAHYQAVWRKPLEMEYHGYQVISSPPPSSGGVVIFEMLNMLNLSHFTRYGMDSAGALHDEIEAMRRAFADRAKYLGDPDFNKLPLATLLSPDYAAQRWASVKPEEASLSSEVGAGPVPNWNGDTETTNYSVVDPSGGAVDVTYTLNFAFGSGATPDQLGFLLNDEMDDFTSKPGVPNGFHLIQGKVNDIEPYKRPLSSMTPTMVTKNGTLLLSLGSPGGPRIITTVFEALTDVLDFGLNIQQAGDAPRFHQQWMPPTVFFEGPDQFSPDTLALLKKMGYPIQVGRQWCDLEGIEVDPKTGMRMAETDPRADGSAMAY